MDIFSFIKWAAILIMTTSAILLIIKKWYIIREKILTKCKTTRYFIQNRTIKWITDKRMYFLILGGIITTATILSLSTFILRDQIQNILEINDQTTAELITFDVTVTSMAALFLTLSLTRGEHNKTNLFTILKSSRSKYKYSIYRCFDITLLSSSTLSLIIISFTLTPLTLILSHLLDGNYNYLYLISAVYSIWIAGLVFIRQFGSITRFRDIEIKQKNNFDMWQMSLPFESTQVQKKEFYEGILSDLENDKLMNFERLHIKFRIMQQDINRMKYLIEKNYNKQCEKQITLTIMYKELILTVIWNSLLNDEGNVDLKGVAIQNLSASKPIQGGGDSWITDKYEKLEGQTISINYIKSVNEINDIDIKGKYNISDKYIKPIKSKYDCMCSIIIAIQFISFVSYLALIEVISNWTLFITTLLIFIISTTYKLITSNHNKLYDNENYIKNIMNRPQ